MIFLLLVDQVKSANLTNAIGVLQGRVEPDRYIIVGAGRDSWSPSNVGGTALLLVNNTLLKSSFIESLF